uniref:hypothetical protein n=1 Tax=uncultured Psychrobacter sp. TaxID=259303 RepID=UPI0025972E79|nr:hypothetical protein [uncultured Psychrobacter sp.]
MTYTNLYLSVFVAGKRILEVGYGMALSSLLLNHRRADITATDYHPTVEYFLDRNTTLNNNKTPDVMAASCHCWRVIQ